jgi:hypothetical protein
MAVGSLICTNDICINIFYDIFGCSGSFITALNGCQYIYDDTISGSAILYTGNCYCSFSYLYPENCLGFGIINTGENDVTGIYCCSARSDGTGSYYWDRIYCSGTFINRTCGHTGEVSGFYSGNLFCTTGYYFCNFFSDGCGGMYGCRIPYSENIFEHNQIFIDICGNQYINGYCSLISDGITTGLIYNFYYCQIGFPFFCSSGLIFSSDGAGGYFNQEIETRNLYNVCISWDFSKRTKNKYNFKQIEACGTALCFSTQNNCDIFYEINAICDTTICIYEANIKHPLFIENSCIPFFYFKNIGGATLHIDLDYEISCRDFFKKCQIYNKINYCNSSLILCKDESIFLTFNVSNCGNEYYSNVYYPFGFFYEFKNIHTSNPYGFYPVCCATDPNSLCKFPIFIYSDLCNLPVENGCVICTGYSYNYKKILSFSENLTVDNSDLEISLEKITGSGNNDYFNINKNFNVKSSFGLNCHNAIICTNQILILDGLNKIPIDYGCAFEKNISSDSSIKVIYDVDFKFYKNYNLIYLDTCCSGANYDFSIVVDSSTGLQEITKNCLCSMGNVLSMNDLDFAYVNLFLCENVAIKNLHNSQIKRDNLYLPLKNDFNYCCCFKLNNSNYKETKIISGSWGTNSGCLPIDSGFCNSVTLINCADSEYQQYKSLNYCLNLCTCESRISSSDIQNKNLFEASEAYLLNYCSIECCYYYCGLEFRYVPVDSILYKKTFYKIPGYLIDLDFYLSGYKETIPFPVNALNFDKLKLITTFDVFDFNYKSEVNIQYSDFSLKLNCECTNYINYKFPIIQCYNFSGYEYPNVSICNNTKHKTQSNITFEVNPLKNFTSDIYYGLNNFLLFVNSKFNNGIALDFINCNTKNMEDYAYDLSCYSFLMMDLACENFCCFSGSTISGNWNKILEYVSFQDDFDLISYKNNSGNGYSYVFPIIEKVCYSDKYTGNNEIINFNKEMNGILNYISTGFNYDGFGTLEVLLTGFDGSVTGTGIASISGASFINSYNFNYINLIRNDLTGTVKSRDITVSKIYNFTGAQPICIVSNYPLVDISMPIVCTNLQEFCCKPNQDETSGLFYYLYNINNPQNKPVKITAPDLTFITQISWNDETISSLPNSSTTAQIVNNLGRINFDINSFIYENPYILNTELTKCLNIKLIGGI